MTNVKIVTDSSAYFRDPALITKLGIEVVPLTVRMGQQSYAERVNQVDEAFMRRLSAEPESVSVDAPTPAYMRGLFGRLGRDSDRIVCVHVSSALNDVAEVARKATASFMGRQRIAVLDTLTTSAGLGMIAEAAARAASDGASQEEVVRIVRGMIPHMYALVFSDALQYLESWGRLGSAQAMLGNMLGLMPIATMEDGDFLPIEKVRNYSRAVDKLHDFVIEFSHVEELYLLQHGFESEAAQLLERLELSYPRRDFPVIEYPPSLAVHVGPRALGVVVYEGVS